MKSTIVRLFVAAGLCLTLGASVARGQMIGTYRDQVWVPLAGGQILPDNVFVVQAQRPFADLTMTFEVTLAAVWQITFTVEASDQTETVGGDSVPQSFSLTPADSVFDYYESDEQDFIDAGDSITSAQLLINAGAESAITLNLVDADEATAGTQAFINDSLDEAPLQARLAVYRSDELPVTLVDSAGTIVGANTVTLFQITSLGSASGQIDSLLGIFGSPWAFLTDSVDGQNSTYLENWNEDNQVRWLPIGLGLDASAGQSAAAPAALLHKPPAVGAIEACCLDNGECLAISRSACDSVEGNPQGPTTTCATAACSGACCLPDDTCEPAAPLGCPDGTFAGLGTSCDPDRLIDGCDPDCNSDGLADSFAFSMGIGEDCNGNDVPDECDIASGQADADGNGVPDVCESSGGGIGGGGIGGGGIGGGGTGDGGDGSGDGGDGDGGGGDGGGGNGSGDGSSNGGDGSAGGDGMGGGSGDGSGDGLGGDGDGDGDGISGGDGDGSSNGGDGSGGDNGSGTGGGCGIGVVTMLPFSVLTLAVQRRRRKRMYRRR